MAANQVDFKILPSDQFSVYSPQTRSDKVITYFTLLSKLRGDILSVGQDDDPNDIVSAFYSSVGGTQTLHLVKADGSEITASVPEPTVGTVTSVDLTASTGISVSGGPITTSGSITVTNTAPDQVVVLTGAGTTSISGTYPSFTITSNDQYVGTVTSVGLTMPAAFSVANSPVTNSGTLAVTAIGLSSQYIRGDGQLANFPTPGGGGSSVNYYLNGSVNQGTFGGVTYYELSKTPIAGAGTNFTRTNASGDGYVASFITDANDPDQINIPGGNFNLEFYFNSSSNGGSPAFYGELYKVSTSNVFTLIASGSANSEVITGGTAVDQYYTSIAVPQTALLSTDRLAIRVYVIVDGRNITLHTENSNFSEVITTFSTGLNSLNGLSDQVQYFAVGTSGTDFAISSSVDTHTFNLPTASATNRGALSSADWTTFNGKASDAFKTIAVAGQPDIVADNATDTLTIVAGTNVTITTNATTDTITINSADQFVGTVTSVDLTAGTGITVSGGPITTSGSITVNNSDRGSSQNIFKNFAVAGQPTIIADDNDDTLTVVAGSGVTITTNSTTDTLTISATGTGGTVTSVATTAPITGGTITTTGTIGITQSGAAADGYLSSTDWNTFNSKEPALTKGNLTEATSSVLTITGGTGAVIGSGTTIQVSQATTTTSGFLSSTDWNTFNNKQGTITLTTTGSTGAATFISNTLNIPNYADQFVGTVTSVAALTIGTTGTDLSSTVANSTTTPVITLNVPTASAANRGALSSADWTTFNSKEPALTKGNLTEATSAVLTITGGTGAVIGTGTSIQVLQSGVSTSGFLSSTDWNTFNGKQSALTFSAPLVNTSGTVSIPAATSLVDGYLSATDFATFNGKQNAITLTTTGTTGAATLIGATLNIPNYADQFVGTVTSVNMSVPTGFAISGNPITTSGTLAVAFAAGYSLPTDASQATWNTAYNDSITAFAYNTSTGALTLTQQDAGTLTATVTLQPFSTTNLTEGTNLYYTDTRARLALSAGTGISYDSATGIITNAAPDQTVILTAGTGITTSGTYPSFTITNSAPDQTVSLTGAGTTTISGTYPSFTITSNDQFVGTVTSVGLTASTGISVSGSPITTSGSITVTNTAPDQVVSLTGAGTTTITGTYPNFTISSDDQYDGTVTSVNLTAGDRIEVSGGPITTSGSITVTHGTSSGADVTTAQSFRLRVIADGGTFEAFNDVAIAIGSLEDIATPQDTDNSGGTVLQNIVLDEFGHLLGVGSITLDTDDIIEGSTNLYFTNARARSALSAGTGITYDTSTGIITNSAPDQVVVLTAGTGITTSGTYPSFTITNSLPDQTVVLTAGTGITTSGTYPNFTVTNSAPDQTVVLTAGTGITTSGTYPNFTVTNAAPDQTVVLTAGTGISVSGTYPSFTVTNSSPSSGGTVTSVAALTIGTTGTDLSSTVVNGTTTPVITLQVPTASAANRGALSSTDWTTFNGKQSAITLTTTGSTGAATFISNTLNIPNYTDQFVGTVTSVATTAPITGGTITTTGTIGITQSGAAADGYLSSTDWGTFNSKQPQLNGTGFVKASGTTISYDNSTYYLASNPSGFTTNTGTVTSVNLTAGARIEVAGGPITTSGSITVTHGVADGADFVTAEEFRDRVIADGGIFEALGEVAIAIGSLSDAASPSSTDYSDGYVLQNIAIDEFGHVLGVGVTDLDDRYVQNLTAGTGITVSGSPSSTAGLITVTNSDRGSSQNIFKNIAVTGQSTIIADLNDDTLTVAAGTGISITTNATTDTLTITNTAASLNPKTESINIRATVPYTVVTPFDDVIIDTVNVQRDAPNTVTSTSKLLAIVTLQVDNTGSIGFTGFTLRLFNQTTSAAVTNTTTKWSAYMYPAASEFGFTSFTYHIPIDDTSVAVSDPIQLQLQLEVGTCDISIANFTLMSISK
jgi:hypothetical protein